VPFATVNPTVFTTSAIVIVLFVLFGVVFTETANTVFSVIHSGITHYFGWFYILAVTIFLGFLIWLSLSRYGTIRLGQPYEKPEFSFIGWFSMLFSAGMGIGLVYWSVAEPILHYENPRGRGHNNRGRPPGHGLFLLSLGTPRLERSTWCSGCPWPISVSANNCR